MIFRDFTTEDRILGEMRHKKTYKNLLVHYWPWWAFAPARSLSAALWKGLNVIHGSYKYTRKVITYKKERSCARLRDSRPGIHVRVTQPSKRFFFIHFVRVLWYLYFHQRCNFQMEIFFTCGEATQVNKRYVSSSSPSSPSNKVQKFAPGGLKLHKNMKFGSKIINVKKYLTSKALLTPHIVPETRIT